MIFTKTKPKKKCGRKPLPDGCKKPCFMALKTTKEFDALVTAAIRIKDLSRRQLFERAVREYVRNDADLKHLLENSACKSEESV